MNRRIDLDDIRVASPCHARWNDMNGNERARFCGQCQKNVYNLSAMTRPQIETLIREKEGKFCGRFYRRADGRMLTMDCPSRLRRIHARMARLGGALGAFLLSFAGCSPRQAGSNSSPTTGQVLMGDVALSSSTCTTNPMPEIMGKIALPTSEPPNTDSRVLMGEIALPTDPGALAK